MSDRAAKPVNAALGAATATRRPLTVSDGCFFVLLVVLALRPFLPETTTNESPALTRSLDVPVGPQPATTLLISGVIALAGVPLVVGRLRRGGMAADWAWLAAGLALSTMAAVISTDAAGQRRLAVNGSVSFLGGLLYYVGLRSAVDRPWRARLTLMVILASGAAFATRCAYQVLVEYPDTREYFAQHRGAWAAALGDDGRGRLHDFEQRLRSNAATGYFIHPNAAGSYLLLVVCAAAGLTVDRMRQPGASGWGLLAPLAVAAMALVGLVLTGSKGAVAGLVIALGVAVMLRVLRARLAGRPRIVLTGAWLALAAAVVTVAAVGWVRGGLPTRSMLFRWQYWRGAAALVREYGVWGVGADNFGRLFTRFKPVECPEEVQDPHSWIVRLGVEWGWPGLLGFLLLLALASRVAARRLTTAGARPPATPSDLAAPPSGLMWLSGVGGAVFLMWWLIYAGADPDYLALMLGLPALAWGFALVTLPVDGSGTMRVRDEPVERWTAILVAAVVGFLAHAAVDVALFTPGAATTFFALLAVLASPPATDAERSESAAPVDLGASLAVGLPWAAATVFVLVSLASVPTAVRCSAALQRARTSPPAAEGVADSPGYASYLAASAADPLDATAAIEVLPQLMAGARSVDDLKPAAGWLETIARRDPFNGAGPRLGTLLHRTRYGLTGDAADLVRAIEAARLWMAAYPTWPPAHLALAGLLVELDAVTSARGARAEAIAAYERALRLDDARVYVSEPNRLGAAARARIEVEIRRLRAGAG